VTAVLGSEWTKLVSVRSTWWCTAVYLLVVGAVASRLSQALPALRVGEDPFLAVPTGWAVGLVVCGVWALGAWAAGAVLLERRDVP
jgi:hypothetical protein